MISSSRLRRLAASSASAAVFLSACGGGAAAPPAPDDLDAATTTVTADDGTQYGAEAFVWKDASPSVVDETEPGPCATSCASVLIVDLSGGQVVDDAFRVTDLSLLVDGEPQRFASGEARGTGRELRPEAYEIVGRRGPDVAVGTLVDVIVLVTLPDGTETVMRVRGSKVEAVS